MPEHLLSVEHLSVDFVSDQGISHALKDISFSVREREVVAIVGESGSGKSVTSLCVLRLLDTPPAKYKSGKILFAGSDDGSDILRQPASALRKLRGNKISMVFQEPMTSLNPLFTCGDQVAEAIILHQQKSKKEAKAMAIDLFKKVQLPEPEKIFYRYPHEISGGQQQRVMIAIAISCRPALLIADEPTTALDVTVQKSILQLIKTLQAERNISVIFISHDLGLVGEIADRIIVMYKGAIVEQGSAKSIFENPQHPYTRALLACRPSLHPRGERLPVVSDFMEVDAGGAVITKDPGILPVRPTRPATSYSLNDTPSPGKAQAPALLEAHDLHVWFPVKKSPGGKAQEYFKAVNGVSFDIRKGETMGLVGESGCGKTTLGRSLLRLIEPASGRIVFNGGDILGLKTEELRKKRKDMQIIFQDPFSSLNPRLTVGDAIDEAMKVHGIGERKQERTEMIMDLLKKVGLLPGHYHHYPHQFSGGQRQRIGIARALALTPSFIICDESVSALDVSVQAQVLNLLNDLKKAFGFSLLFISHDLSVVRYISDRMLVMRNGKIEESGDAEEIYNNPQQEYTRKLIAAIPSIRR